MPATAASRHLLFGILSLQNGFITKEDLVAATSLWLEDKSLLLADLLEQRFGLKPEVRALVEALVEKHCELHHGDAEASLAAISSVEAVRDDLMALGDTDVDASVTAMFDVTYVPPVSNGLAGSASSAEVSVPSPGRFRILRPHARGGLGKVSIAQDEELQREVALKELLPQRADVPDSRARFLREAQITGRLEHPGIVPVYGLGQYADGRPFYAMRFIRGDSLQEAIVRYHSAEHRLDRPAVRSLDLRKLLGRFIDVCDAIDYAHSRHILHRDLKPGNVMIGNYGETLVVDWGLAKNYEQTDPGGETIDPVAVDAADSDSVPTQLGTAVGTPAYMSPEQAAGRLEVLGPAADVYGLGATLHCLLTGRPPVSGSSIEETLSKVQRGEVPSPKTIDPKIPRPLDAICRKAMALAPRERYPTARALADDVERWLADEPVEAFPEPVTHKLARWGRRHRTAVQVAFAALAVIAAVATVAAVTVNRTRQTAVAALAAETQAKQEAAGQRDRANRNFALARGAVDNLFTKASESALLSQAGAQPVRKELLEQARDYYEAFLEAEADSDELADELAASQFRVGRIIELVESRDEAIDVYRQVAALQRSLLEKTPRDADRIHALSMTLNALGRAHHVTQQIDAAQGYYDEARDLREQLLTLAPDNNEYHRLLANSIMNLGLVARDQGDPDRGVEMIQTSQELRDRRIEQGDQRATIKRDLGKGYFNLGLLAAVRGDQVAAREALGEAIEIFESLDAVAGDGDIDKIANLDHLALCYRLLGDLYRADVASDDAERWYETARDRMEQLVRQNPSVAQLKANLANLVTNQADRERLREDFVAARQSFERAGQIQMQLWERFGEPLYLRDAATATRELALLQSQLGDSDAARETLEDLADLLRLQEGDFSLELEAVEEALQQVSEQAESEQ